MSENRERPYRLLNQAWVRTPARRRLQILDDLSRDLLGRRQVVAVRKGFISQLEDVETGLVAGIQLVVVDRYCPLRGTRERRAADIARGQTRS